MDTIILELKSNIINSTKEFNDLLIENAHNNLMIEKAEKIKRNTYEDEILRLLKIAFEKKNEIAFKNFISEFIELLVAKRDGASIISFNKDQIDNRTLEAYYSVQSEEHNKFLIACENLLTMISKKRNSFIGNYSFKSYQDYKKFFTDSLDTEDERKFYKTFFDILFKEDGNKEKQIKMIQYAKEAKILYDIKNVDDRTHELFIRENIYLRIQGEDKLNKFYHYDPLLLLSNKFFCRYLFKKLYNGFSHEFDVRNMKIAEFFNELQSEKISFLNYNPYIDASKFANLHSSKYNIKLYLSEKSKKNMVSVSNDNLSKVLFAYKYNLFPLLYEDNINALLEETVDAFNDDTFLNYNKKIIDILSAINGQFDGIYSDDLKAYMSKIKIDMDIKNEEVSDVENSDINKFERVKEKIRKALLGFILYINNFQNKLNRDKKNYSQVVIEDSYSEEDLNNARRVIKLIEWLMIRCNLNLDTIQLSNNYMIFYIIKDKIITKRDYELKELRTIVNIIKESKNIIEEMKLLICKIIQDHIGIMDIKKSHLDITLPEFYIEPYELFFKTTEQSKELINLSDNIINNDLQISYFHLNIIDKLSKFKLNKLSDLQESLRVEWYLSSMSNRYEELSKMISFLNLITMKKEENLYIKKKEVPRGINVLKNLKSFDINDFTNLLDITYDKNNLLINQIIKLNVNVGKLPDKKVADENKLFENIYNFDMIKNNKKIERQIFDAVRGDIIFGESIKEKKDEMKNTFKSRFSNSFGEDVRIIYDYLKNNAILIKNNANPGANMTFEDTFDASVNEFAEQYKINFKESNQDFNHYDVKVANTKELKMVNGTENVIKFELDRGIEIDKILYSFYMNAITDNYNLDELKFDTGEKINAILNSQLLISLTKLETNILNLLDDYKKFIFVSILKELKENVKNGINNVSKIFLFKLALIYDFLSSNYSRLINDKNSAFLMHVENLKNLGEIEKVFNHQLFPDLDEYSKVNTDAAFFKEKKYLLDKYVDNGFNVLNLFYKKLNTASINYIISSRMVSNELERFLYFIYFNNLSNNIGNIFVSRNHLSDIYQEVCNKLNGDMLKYFENIYKNIKDGDIIMTEKSLEYILSGILKDNKKIARSKNTAVLLSLITSLNSIKKVKEILKDEDTTISIKSLLRSIRNITEEFDKEENEKYKEKYKDYVKFYSSTNKDSFIELEKYNEKVLKEINFNDIFNIIFDKRNRLKNVEKDVAIFLSNYQKNIINEHEKGTEIKYFFMTKMDKIISSNILNTKNINLYLYIKILYLNNFIAIR